MTDKIKSTMRIISFVLVFSVALSTLSQTVFSSENVGKTSGKLADAFSFLDEPDDSINVVALGNSNMYSGFVPISLWDSCGYTSIVSSAAHQTPLECKMLLEQILESQNPGLVILETDMLYDGGVNKSDGGFFSQLYNDFENYIATGFSMFEFHNAWKSILNSDRSHQYSHGYYFNNDVEYNDASGYMMYNEELEMPNERVYSQFVELVEYCREKGMQVMMIEMPSLNSWNYARHNAVSEIARSLNIEFLDANLLYDEMNVDLSYAFRDKGYHLNYDSASRLTQYVGDFIKEYYDIPLCKDDIADYWNEESFLFKEYYEIY